MEPQRRKGRKEKLGAYPNLSVPIKKVLLFMSGFGFAGLGLARVFGFLCVLCDFAVQTCFLHMTYK